MAQRRIMATLARWHIWLGWLVGVPLLLWTLSGLFMVLKPIEEVRGNHLRRELPAALPLPQGVRLEAPFLALRQPRVREFRVVKDNGRAVAIATYLDGAAMRFDALTGEMLPPLDETAVRAIVARQVIGGEKAPTAVLHDSDDPPSDWRQDEAVWKVGLKDGTNVYVDPVTGEIEAVRTRWWRFYDFMWGLHIMDLETREDTHHPLLIGFAALSLAGTAIGCALLFRRRRRART